MTPPRVLAHLLVVLAATPAVAVAGSVPLQPLPEAKLAALAPTLRHGEVALIESEPGGRMKQVTIIALAAAPVELVRQVVSTPEKWPDFVANVSRSRVTRYPDGSLDYDFELNLSLVSLQTNYHMTPQPDGGLEVHDNDPSDHSCQLWRFYPVPGGTIIVQYGYSHLLHANKFLRNVIDAAPPSEHGLALAAQLAYVRAMKLRAERLAPPGSVSPADLSARGPGFGFLLERGRVAVVRSQPDGKLADISILDQVGAPAERVLQVIGAPGDYAGFMDGVRRSVVRSVEGTDTVYELRQDLSAVHLESRFHMRRGTGAVDVVGESGDQRALHVRWDVTARGDARSLLVYRANQDLASASPLLLGLLFRLAPFFEPGIAVAIGLIYEVGVRARAEGKR